MRNFILQSHPIDENYQYKLYLNATDPIFLGWWKAAPDLFTPSIGDYIQIQGQFGRMFKVIRFEPPTGNSNVCPVDKATNIIVEYYDPSQPESTDDQANPIEYDWIYNKVF